MIDRRPDLEVIDVSQNGLLTDMDTPQYSLRWNNHLVHMMDAIEVLLQNETLVDVTLVCEKTQFKAHKVVLSACSPYFQRLFSETPCKHPVIVLKDLPDWEMRAIIHFMYKGEINVGQEQLPLLLQAAETLQIRGLAHTERIPLFVDSPTSSSATPTDIQPPPSQQKQQPPLPSSHHHGVGGHHHHHHHHSSRGQSPGGSKSSTTAGHELTNGQSSPGKGHHHHHHHHRHRTTDSPQSPRNKSQPPPHHALGLPPPHHRDGSAGRMSPTTRMFFQAAAAAAAAAAANPYDPSHIHLPQIQHLPPITFNDRNCPSPTPRRKQARPRRRSGEAIGPQDLSKAPSPSNFSNNVAENLSMKKSPNNENINNENVPTNLSCNNKRPDRTPSPSANKQMKVEVEESEMIGDLGQNLPVELTANSGNPNVNNNNNNNNQSSNKKNHHHHHHHHLNHQQQHQRHPDFPYYGPDPMSIPLNPHDPHFENSLFPPFGPLSSLSLQGPPHSLFPGLDGCRNPLLNELIEPRFDNPPPSKKKKKMFPVGRPKGQHSAPRGGPPRSWTNAELTEALQHVWNKKMTTSQASRIFGIPYNSLLMYVRGKYGKSLKLEQLKKECFGDINGPLDLLHLGSISNNNNSSNKNNNNNNNNSSNSNNNNSGGGGNNGQSNINGSGNNNGGGGNGSSLQPCNPPSEPVDLMLGPPGFNPPAFPAPNFFPDFGSTFPMGIDMIHLMHQQQQHMSSMSAADKHQYLGLQDMIGGQPLQSAVVLDYAMKSPAASRSNSEPPTTGGEGDGDGDGDGDVDGDGEGEGDGDCDDDDGDDDCGVDDEEDEDEDDDVVAMDFSKAGGIGVGGGGGGGDVGSGGGDGDVGGGAGAGDEDDGVDDEDDDEDVEDERLSPEADDKDKEQD
ncbi:transcription factor mef2A-like isoform X2 [Myzus persicae]|uniref:transcription factor mef2A-like isoform X2 n=1 Tax=Myzus persicae TaxID=13164 RepID=UPI000B931785|nr:transcription factor mef2A-like isoform X2 [Myzus persicae]